jgi:hypothetical protein
MRWLANRHCDSAYYMSRPSAGRSESLELLWDRFRALAVFA